MSQKTTAPKAMRVITLILCIILAIVLIGNLTVIIKGTLNEDRPPSMFGMTSMIVMSGSMSGDAPDHIEIGDLIVAKAVDPATLQVGDVITFMERGVT
ncbi:MAG: signal peptidase I, partial [Clostridia bacterium]|nr:signal peptidase I [Clostridia bacterium]